ncbi:hypothetical protein V494_05842 [Pseudogymnoascus sp. VKM F-4513 (FW-928)]|nr:hypothetical protein V494_05842 [Pseudogymnoascus sp. VKM F-4513 (FW-928)]
MIEGIVSLAFGGPAAIKSGDIPDGLTGILNPGVHDGARVNLLPFFNGSIASTNLNNQAVGINWLDDGGILPLSNYLSGQTDSVVLKNETNEYRLFGHFYTAFAKVFGCSHPPPSPTAGDAPNPAYIHKFMGLNFIELGYFINQLTLASEYYGFSTTDAQSLAQLMNTRYNTRCGPPTSVNTHKTPQLLSLCQDPTCPLAVPNSNCEPYVNLTADSSSSSSPSESSNTASSPTSGATDTSSGSKGLSSGGIAGVAIGGVALLALIIAVIFYLRRKRRPKTPPPQPEVRWTGNSESFVGSPAGGQGYLSPQSEHFSAYSPNSRDSYVSHAHTSYTPKPVELATPQLPVELSGETGVSADTYRRSQGMT